MSWRETFLSRLGTGYFSGITPSLWLRVLRDNDFAIDLPYWPRALAITFGSLQNSFLARWETWAYGRGIRDATVYPPLFILGIWRSGTTLLHNLLVQDDRFAFANNYQTCFPKTFLTTESTNSRVVGFFLPERRPQDGIALGMGQPQEDEFALGSLTGRSISMGWVFPRRADQFHRYLTFREAKADDIAEWKAALAGFVRKLSFKYKRPVVLKSPAHTGRIRMLLELFPDARFVHIHRNPYDVFQSTRHLHQKVTPWLTLQRSDERGVDDRILRQYRDLYEVFFEERSLIPAGRYHEIGFEDLEADPIAQLRGVYGGLGLPDFGHVEPSLERYVSSLAGYMKNKFSALTRTERDRVATEWRRCFDEWGYSRGTGLHGR